jgi:L-threonylcarbamoyladenylate synthase
VTVGPQLLNADSEAMAMAVRALRKGLVVAIPTDTVYGLAVDPLRPEAVAKLFALKERPSEVALPVLIGRRKDTEVVAGRLEIAAEHLAGRYWPGPLTLVVPRGKRFTVDLGGPRAARRMVGVRLSGHPVVQGLCRELGPLAVTSANLHGAPAATSALEVEEVFAGNDGIAAILDGGVCNGLPSTVVECHGTSVRCLREGALPWSEVFDHR